MVRKNKKNMLTLYPSNWIYNASVIGLLKVLESENFNRVKFSFGNDGEVEIKKELLRKSYGILEKINDKNKFTTIFGLNKFHPNYIQKEEKQFFEEIWLHNLSDVDVGKVSKPCSWCSGIFINDVAIINSIKNKSGSSDSEKFKKCIQIFEKFKKRMEMFQITHTKELGPSIGEMPNAFWNLNFSTPICHLCSYLVLFYPFAFIDINKRDSVFINTPSFRLMWDLNKLAEIIIPNQNNKNKLETKKVFAESLLQWTIKRRTLLGSWTTNNLELILRRKIRRKNKEETIVNYFDLPWEVTKVLLDYRVAQIIYNIGEEEIFNTILTGKFYELEIINYYILRAIKILKSDISKERLVVNSIPIYKLNLEYDNLVKISKNLPKLFIRIQYILGRNEMEIYNNIDWLVNKLIKVGNELSEVIKDSLNKIAFKILEQTRLGERENVYYMFLRIFKSHDEKIPEELIEVFKPINNKYFKTLVYSFLSPILGEKID